jgi:hypothetical protein
MRGDALVRFGGRAEETDRPKRPTPRLGPTPYTHFTQCKRVVYAIVDVVTRYWIGYLLTSEQTHTQVQLLFASALEEEGLLGPDGLPIDRTATDRSWSRAQTTVRR